MSGARDGFGLLEAGGRPSAAVRVRPVGDVLPKGQMYLGLDSEGRRHLYVPLSPDEEFAEDRRSRGVVLVEDTLADDTGEHRFADLGCTSPALHEVFARVVEDALAKVENRPEDPAGAVRAALDQWRAMFRDKPAGLGEEQVLGLVGELEILARLTVLNRIDTWLGPLGGLHDFRTSAHDIEVKATTARGDEALTISGLDQLDPAGGQLYLAVVNLVQHGDAPTLGDRVAELIAAGLPGDQLQDLMGAAGYVAGHDAARGRFSVDRLRVWHVEHETPGLRRSDIPAGRQTGVGTVRYSLRADALGAPLVDEAVAAVFGGTAPA